MPTLSAVLQAAQLVAIERLVRIVRDSPSEREARLAAQALLKTNPNTVAQPEAKPDPGLTTEELAHLRRLLPHTRPERFSRRAPAYWRTMLAHHAPPASPLRQAG